jgi:FAD/FMN-containing dehydrogenase
MTLHAHATVPASAPPDVRRLRMRMAGRVVTSSDADWDVARSAWNLSADQRPAAVAIPANADDVVAVVQYARANGLRVAPQGTGHNGTALSSLEDAILVKTSEMRGVSIDIAARRGRVEAGAIWLDVATPASEVGLAGLAGSSPDVGIVGYSLGGGIGWLARKYGMATNSIEAIELVTAAGEHVRADRENETDLFWAMRGGGGNFGVVTAMEFRLYPVSSIYAGWLAWPWEDAERVLPVWSEWAANAPDETSTSFRIMQLPPIEEIPEPIRGRQLVVIDGAVLGDEAHGREVIRPLRELGAEIDTWAMVPPVALSHLHGDPEHPVPGASRSAMVRELPSEAQEAFVAAAGPGSGSALLIAELRQLGGALGRPAPGAGALPQLDGAHALFGVGLTMSPEMAAAVNRSAEHLVDSMSPWTSGNYLNFAEEPETDARTGYAPHAYRRLEQIKAAVDPDGLIMANHQIRPAR